MSSDEDDYMSDKFLTGNIQNDIRPGLIVSHKEKRNFEALKRKQEKDELHKKNNPNVKVLESEKRKEGLEKPIERNNKGFAMLQKMGYKPGTSIGKTESGRTEPIPINLKADREGLGRSEMRKEMVRKKLKEARKEESVSTEEYRSRMTGKVNQRQMESDLRRSQRVCERLDTDNDVIEPVEKWFWFSTVMAAQKGKKNAKKRKTDYAYNEDSDDNQLNVEDEDDSNELEGSDSQSEEEEEEEDVQLDIDEMLSTITGYLREKYFYCIWCSVEYNDDEDLAKECPGRSRDDH